MGWGGGVSPDGGGDGGGGVTGDGELSLLSPEHSHTVHDEKAHIGSVSGGGEASRVTGGQVMVGAGRFVIGGDVDVSFGGRTGGGGGGGLYRKSQERNIKLIR